MVASYKYKEEEEAVRQAAAADDDEVMRRRKRAIPNLKPCPESPAATTRPLNFLSLLIIHVRGRREVEGNGKTMDGGRGQGGGGGGEEDVIPIDPKVTIPGVRIEANPREDTGSRGEVGEVSLDEGAIPNEEEEGE